MLSDTPFTKENLDVYLKALAKEYRKLSGKNMPAEIILIGGAAVLANYGFREITYDIDAVILAASTMKQAINNVGDNLNLPNGWLNADFKNTKSYSQKLFGVSVYYKTFSNVLTIRTIAAEYLIAMKLISGRQYKYDLSDVIGILAEHSKAGKPISRDAIDRAVVELYGDSVKIPATAKVFIDDVFTRKDYEQVYAEIRESEKQSMAILSDFKQNCPDELKEENIADIIAHAKKKKSVLEQLADSKKQVEENDKATTPQKKRNKSHEL